MPPNHKKKQSFFAILFPGTETAFFNILSATALALFIFSNKLFDYASLGLLLFLGSALAISLLPYLLTKEETIFTPQYFPIIYLSFILDHFQKELNQEQLLTNTLIVISLNTLVFGLIAFSLGKLNGSKLIRFIPYPVICGLIGGTGLLFLKKILCFLFDVKECSFTELFTVHTEDAYIRLAIASAIGLVLLIASKFKEQYYLRGAFIFLLLSFLFPFVFSTDWKIGDISLQKALHLPFNLSLIDVHLLLHSLPYILIGVVISISVLLFNLSRIEDDQEREFKQNNEIKLAGIVNVVIGLLGGIVGHQGYIITRIIDTYRITKRTASITAAAITLLFILTGFFLIGYIQRPIISGILLFISFRIITDCIIEPYTKVPPLEKFFLIAIALSFALISIKVGILMAIVFALFIFIYSYSLVNIIKFTLDGRNIRSNVDRDTKELFILKDEGDEILILKLQGFLFFGTVDVIAEAIEARLNQKGLNPLKYIIIDFNLISGTDYSSLIGITRLINYIEKHNIHLVFSNFPPETFRKIESILVNERKEKGMEKEDRFLNSILNFPSFDLALVWCENKILATHKGKLILEKKLLKLPEEIFTKYWEKKYYGINEYLIRQGEDSNSLFFIEKGTVDVFLELPDKETIHLRTIKDGNILGEMGFFLGYSRISSVVANTYTIAYVIEKEKFEKLKDENPQLATDFEEFLVRKLALRLLSSNQTIQALTK